MHFAQVASSIVSTERKIGLHLDGPAQLWLQSAQPSPFQPLALEPPHVHEHSEVKLCETPAPPPPDPEQDPELAPLAEPPIIPLHHEIQALVFVFAGILAPG